MLPLPLMLWVILGDVTMMDSVDLTSFKLTELNHLSSANALELVLVQIVLCVCSYVCWCTHEIVHEEARERLWRLLSHHPCLAFETGDLAGMEFFR